MEVAATESGQDSDKQQAYQAGFDYHVLKPVELDRIVEIFRELEQ